MFVNVIIADDHPMFFEGLANVLKRNTHILDMIHAKNGAEVLQILEENKKDYELVFMDISMPVMDGIESTKRLTSRFPHVKVIALSQHDDKGRITEMMNSGAKGYLLKNSDSETIHNAIEKVLKGKKYYSPDVAEILLENTSEVDDSSNELTDLDKEILICICQELTTKEIAEKLKISTHSIDFYKRKLFEKTGAKSIAGLVTYAHTYGIYKH